MNVCGFIANNARARANVPAIIEGERVLSYREVDIAIRRAAALLRARGVRAGDRVGFVMKDNADHMLLMLAAARLGAAAVVIDWRAPAAAQAATANRFDVAVVVADSSLPVSGIDAGIVVDEAWARDLATTAPGEDFPDDGSAVFTIGTTSGTTGDVKGIPITHDIAAARAAAAFLGHRWRLGERFFAASSFTFIVGRMFPLFHLMAGNTVIFYPPLCAPDEYVKMAAQTGANAGFIVGSALRRLAALPDRGAPLLDGMRVLSIGGEPLTTEDKRNAMRRFAPMLIESYGATGTGVAATQALDDEADLDSVGRTLPLLSVEAVDEHANPVGPGAVGRLRFRGPVVARGFYDGDAGGDESFSGGWYYPGDFGRLTERGHLVLAGRRADIIIRGGANVFAGEVEAVLRAHDAVADAAVVGWPSRTLGEEVGAFVVLSAAAEASALLRHCRDHLPAYKLPKDIFIVDALPVGATGKVQKRALAERLTPLP